MNNKERARDAATAIDAFVRTQEPRASDLESAISQTPDEFLVDLLTDLRHWAHQNGVDFEDAVRRADGHFRNELFEEKLDIEADFVNWSGGFNTDECDEPQKNIYLKTALPSQYDESEARRWMLPTKEEGVRGQREPLAVQIAKSAPDLWEIVRLLAEREAASDPLIQDAVALVTKIEGGAA